MGMIELLSREISSDNPPFWRKGEFLAGSKTVSGLSANSTCFLEVPGGFYISQLSRDNFGEFDDLRVNPSSFEIRKNGCGVAALFMGLGCLKKEGVFEICPTVGFLALQLCCFHRNDLRDGNGNSIVQGTPVYGKRGWYHDALCFYAKSMAGVRAERRTSMDLEGIACQLEQRNHSGVGVSIASVSNIYWREENEPKSNGGHLVLVHGFKTGDEGMVSHLLVTDSYTLGEPKLNKWLPVDDRIRSSFTGNAIFIYKEDEEPA